MPPKAKGVKRKSRAKNDSKSKRVKENQDAQTEKFICEVYNGEVSKQFKKHYQAMINTLTKKEEEAEQSGKWSREISMSMMSWIHSFISPSKDPADVNYYDQHKHPLYEPDLMDDQMKKYTARLLYIHLTHEFLQSECKPVLMSKSGFELLRSLSVQWSQYRLLYLKWMEFVFYSAYSDVGGQDQPYALGGSNKMEYRGVKVELPFYQQGFLLFHNLIKDHFHDIIAVALQLVHDFRVGVSEDFFPVKCVLEIAYECDKEVGFDHILVPQAKEATRLFFSRKANELLETSDCCTYLGKCEVILTDESRQLDFWCHKDKDVNKDTRSQLFAIAETQLLTEKLDFLLSMETGFNYLLLHNRVDDLRRFFILFSSVDSPLENSILPSIADCLRVFIEKEGMELMVDSNSRSLEIVPKITAFHDRFADLVNKAFAGHAIFVKALDEAHITFLNQNNFAHSLSVYVHSVMKPGAKDFSEDAALTAALESIMGILKYIDDKDIFLAFLGQDLSRRLMKHDSAQRDKERQFIVMMKQVLEHGECRKLERMLQDCDSTTPQDFVDYCKDNDIHTGHELTVRVLSQGFWPNTFNPALGDGFLAPPSFLTYQKTFGEWYQSKYNGRKLCWLPQWGECQIKATFQPGYTRSLTVGFEQAAVLLLFSDPTVTSLTFQSVSEQTGIPLDSRDGRRNLTEVCQPLLKSKIISHDPTKVKVLASASPPKESKGESSTNPKAKTTITPLPDCLLSFNTKFKTKRHKLILTNAAARERKVEESRKIIEQTYQDRIPLLKAATVRVMKANKQMNLQDLFTSVCGIVKVHFSNLQMKTVKKVIEMLIDGDYMERSIGDRNNFLYKA